MANSLQQPGPQGLALAVTEDARTAGLVEEDADENPRYLAKVRVYSFDQLLLVVDRDQLSDSEIKGLVETAMQARNSIYQAVNATVTTYGGGGGYRVQLPPAADAGFQKGDKLPSHPAPNMLVLSPLDRGLVVEPLLEQRQRQIEDDR